jgi:hypothetical protein
MNWKPFYTKEFTEVGNTVSISRGELESLGCPIDVTQVTDEQMEIVAEKIYESEGQTMLDIAEPWLMKNTKAKYLEDYGKKELAEYQKRAKEVYYGCNVCQIHTVY